MEKKIEDFPKGTPVIAELFAATRIGVVTGGNGEDVVMIDGKATFLSDIKYDLRKDNPLKIKYHGHSPEEVEKIKEITR